MSFGIRGTYPWLFCANLKEGGGKNDGILKKTTTSERRFNFDLIVSENSA